MKDKLEELLKTTPEHILKARDMAQGIYKEKSSKHSEMLLEIKKHLNKLHQVEIDKINNI